MTDDAEKKLIDLIPIELRNVEIGFTAEELDRLFIALKNVQYSVLESAQFVAAAITATNAEEKKDEFQSHLNRNFSEFSNLIGDMLKRKFGTNGK